MQAFIVIHITTYTIHIMLLYSAYIPSWTNYCLHLIDSWVFNRTTGENSFFFFTLYFVSYTNFLYFKIYYSYFLFKIQFLSILICFLQKTIITCNYNYAFDIAFCVHLLFGLNILFIYFPLLFRENKLVFLSLHTTYRIVNRQIWIYEQDRFICVNLIEFSSTRFF